MANSYIIRLQDLIQIFSTSNWNPKPWRKHMPSKSLLPCLGSLSVFVCLICGSYYINRNPLLVKYMEYSHDRMGFPSTVSMKEFIIETTKWWPSIPILRTWQYLPPLHKDCLWKEMPVNLILSILTVAKEFSRWRRELSCHLLL